MSACAFCHEKGVKPPRVYCSLQCWGKARAATKRTAAPPPPVEGAAWIPLADGRFALVDAEAETRVREHSWCGGGSRGQYAKTYAGGRGLYLHHFVMGGRRVDHKNGNALDCRRENLRPATQRQNAGNMKSRARSAPYKGIARAGRNLTSWSASIRANGKRVYLGNFKTPEEAARAYDDAARRVHGEFACVNFPESGERGALAS